jgi:hypothetical protein
MASSAAKEVIIAYAVIVIVALFASMLGVDFPGPIAVFFAVSQAVVFFFLELVSPQRFCRFTPRAILIRVISVLIITVLIVL